MKKLLLFLAALLFIASNMVAQTNADIYLNATTCGDFEVKIEPDANLSSTTLTNIQFTIQWPVTTPNASLVNASSSYPLAQQGSTAQSGGYNYATFVGIDVPVNWTASTQYEVLTFSHDHGGSGTGDFVIMPASDGYASVSNVFYVEHLGSDITGGINNNAAGVDLGLCPLTITGTFTANNKVYDGNADATFNTYGLTLDGVKTGDVVTLLQGDVVIEFSDENVGNGKTVSITGATLSGADAAKYDLSIVGAPTTNADITAKELTIGGSFTALDKVYDGNTDATINDNSLTLITPETGDVVSLTSIVLDFADPNVNTGIAVSITSAALTGAEAGNYSLSLTGAPTTTADITAKTLTAAIIGNPTKEYDGTTTATLAPANYEITGLITGESISVTETVGNYAAANVGIHIVTVNHDASDFTAGGGTLLSNYTLPTVAQGNGTITLAARTLKVLLQGPYDDVLHEMKTDLNTNGQLPTTQPFNIAPWNYTGTESLPGTLTDEVDWVLVELRTGTSETTLHERAASLVNKDGSVSVSFNSIVPNVGYYIVIWHRNHMPVMSASAFEIHNETGPYDFTVLANCYGTDPAILLEGTTYGMIAGDVTMNGMLKYSGPGNDRGPIIARIVAETGSNNTNGFTDPGYWQEDVSLNSIVLYLGSDNDRAYIANNLAPLTGTPYLNNTYTSVVPGAYTESKDEFNDGPVDIQFTETTEDLAIEIVFNEQVTNGMIDNIQFTLAWKVGDSEIEELLNTFSSSFNLLPQGGAIVFDGINYQTYVSVTPNYLPQTLNSGEAITVLTCEKEYGQLVESRLWIADNEFTFENNGEYYVSNWGSDATGIIHTLAVGIENMDEGFVKLYPNPVNSGKLFMQINTTQSENLVTEIVDVRGKLIKKLDNYNVTGTMTFKIDVSGFNTGVYLINVIGDKVHFKDKFIVK